mmetsp:Transcript_29418/g.61260  ORF Transcript_29418/g.61260 Transcript_29418/m.61260 type:complete len:686 (+) Transcript_29418:43-2100(+)
MSKQSLTAGDLGGADNLSHQPYILYAISNKPPGSIGSSGTSCGSGGPHGRDPIQILCPYTGSNVTGAHPLRVPASSSSGRGGTFGVRCLLPVPLTTMLRGGGDDANATIFIGHGGGGGEKPREGGGKDDHAFLLNRHSGGSASSVGGNNPRWKVRLPEQLSHTPQSMAVSPDGRFLAAGSTNGTCFLWDWTAGEDNLVKVWKAHYRPVTCLTFDKDEGVTLFTAGEDGVVNAWCLLDLIDQDSFSGSSSGAVHPFRTWSEHHLAVTSLCVLCGSGCGATRLISSSLDRNLIIMELGGSGSISNSADGSNSARTLARICLPSGLHSVISDSSNGRLYGAGSDGNIYCIDLDRRAIHESLDGAGTFINVNQGRDYLFTSKQEQGEGAGNFESLLSGRHMMISNSTAGVSGMATYQSKYLSELKGHMKSVTCLALLDPSDLAATSTGQKGTTLLASGSDDGTVRIWDLNSRSCVKVLRPWSPSSEGVNINSASSVASSPPISSIIAVPKSSLAVGSLSMKSGGGSMGDSSLRSIFGRRSIANVDYSNLFKPLKRFVRGTSVVDQSHLYNTTMVSYDCAPAVWPRRDQRYVRFWEDNSLCDFFVRSSKKAKTTASIAKSYGDDDGSSTASSTFEDDDKTDELLEEGTDDKAEIARLRKALQDSQAVIERWQTVNNQLVSKLKNVPSKQC